MKLSDTLKFIFCLVLVCFTVVSRADNESNPPLPEVACRYEMRIIPDNKLQAPSNKAWFFWRKADMVQIRDTDGDHGEIWQRTAKDSIQYRKLYHADKTAVEYMSTDNEANNMSFDWFKLSSMLSQQELATLKPVQKLHVLGRDAELRTGEKDGQIMEVLWLLNENLPARIIRKNKTLSIELRLVEITSLSAAQPKPVTIEDIANYRQIDATDFGDMENDPFVKKVMAVDSHHHHEYAVTLRP